jgi:RNA polymerase sigma factor (sigma-70 family)
VNPPAPPPSRVDLHLVPGAHDDDHALIARARGGDLDAYGALVARHQDVAFRTAYVISGNAAEAEEAAQEAFVKAHAALGRFREGAPWRPWLLTIVANEARNRRRSAGRREHLAVRAAAAEPPRSEASAESAVLLAQRREAVHEALARLAERDREVVFLRFFLDLTEAETAAALGCRPGTVKSRLHRALERLRAHLEDDDAA